MLLNGVLRLSVGVGKPYQGEYVTELNVERFELREDGNIAFSHPKGTHDNVFWATAYRSLTFPFLLSNGDYA